MSQLPAFFLLSLPLVAVFAMFSIGIVVIYRASRVLNLSHGAMAMVPAFVAWTVWRTGIPPVLATVVGVVAGVVIGLVVERAFVRTLRVQGSTAQTVGTVAALGLLMALAIKVWGTTPRLGMKVFPEGGISVGASLFRWGHMGLFGIALLASAAFFALFRYTDVGLAMRAAADNRRAASLMGIDPDHTTKLAWAIGGGLAAIAGILLAAVTTLHPINLSLIVLPGFVAALIGGLESLPGAVAGATVVGLVQGMVPAFGLIPGIGKFVAQIGFPQLVLTILALGVMMGRGSRFAGAATGNEAVATATVPRMRKRPRAAAGEGVLGVLRQRPELVAVGIGALVWPWLGVPISFVGDAIQASVILLVGLSLVLLTGWVGQISLGQAAFVGIGAFVTGILSEKASLPFPMNLPVSAGIAAGVAALLGLVALRVRGLYLAVATLIFMWMSSEFLFRQPWLVGAGTAPTPDIGRPDAFPFFDLSNRRTFYYIAIAAAATALWAVANVRDSKTGRAFAAVRGSEMAAVSLGIDVTRYKLLAFAMSGFLAGAAGNILIVGSGAASPDEFNFNTSLFYLAVAVVGGLTSLGGAAGAAILFAGLEELFFRVQALAGWLDVVSAGLLAFVLLAYPGGLARVPESLEGALRLARVRTGPILRRLAPAGRAWATLVAAAIARIPRRRPVPVAAADGPDGLVDAFGPHGEILEAAALGTEPDFDIPAMGNGEVRSTDAAVMTELVLPVERSTDRTQREALLEARDVVVRFGGLLAVDTVSLSVREGEIVGLIGPNGAGKTTTFNAISGLVVPTAGTVHLFGEDVTDWPVHRRAELGVARTFQVIQLFSHLTVFDNLLVATHVQNPTGVFSHLVVSGVALEEESAARERVWAAIDLLDLHEIALRPVAGLPFGMLRMVEVARAIVTAAPLWMLDEPASGLDNAETTQLIELLRFVRDELDVSMLLIEHDVRMVTSVSDYMYVIDRGMPLAEGRPEEIQRDEKVMAAYLGEATPATAQAR